MLRFLLLLVCAISASLASASLSDAAPWVIGHRGLGQGHAPEPENSVLALSAALQMGATAVEFDVQLTSDGQVILAHDSRLERITDGQGCVAETPFADMKQLSLKDGKGRVHPEVGVGTFTEALEVLKAQDVSGPVVRSRPFIADIHIKVYDFFRGDYGGWDNHGCRRTAWAELTDRVLAQTAQAGLMDRVIFTSFDRRVLNRIRAAYPRAKVGLLTMLDSKGAIEFAHKRRYNFVALNDFRFTPVQVSRAHESGIQVLSWSPSTLSQLDWERDAGVDGWITDNVPAAIDRNRSTQP
ncbi:glycerophosphodiester phosphodiesterase family protein [Bdellovibrionota bacterium FG-1]